MNRAELIASVQKALRSNKVGAERAVDAVLDSIKLGVKKNKNVKLVGFGTFKVGNRKARMCVNPKTGEKIKVKASRVIKFAAGKAFKNSL